MTQKNDMKKGLDDLLAAPGKKQKPVSKPSKEITADEQFESIKIEHNPVRRGRPAKTEQPNGRDSLTTQFRRTSLMVNKELYKKISTIASINSLSVSEVINASLKLYITMYENKHGEITPRESNISADSLI